MRAYVKGDFLYFESIEELVCYMNKEGIMQADCCADGITFTVVL